MTIKAAMLAFAAAMVSIAGSAHAQRTGEIGQMASNNATEVVCRRMAPPTGTRLGARNICKTQADWDAFEEANRREVQRQQDASHWAACPGAGGCD